jgi:hypothetical protein
LTRYSRIWGWLNGERFAVFWLVKHLKNRPKRSLSKKSIELVNIGRATERDIQAEAKERMSEGGKGSVKNTTLCELAGNAL